MKQDEREKKIHDLATKLTMLVDAFRQGESARDYNWWQGESPISIFSPLYGYQKAEMPFREVVEGMLVLNPQMLSRHHIEISLMYEFLLKQTTIMTQAQHLNDPSLTDSAFRFLKDMAEFSAWQDVDIAIANLELEGDPVPLGNATFMRLPENEVSRWKSDPVFWPPDAVIRLISRVRAPGDRDRALSYARAKTDFALGILRAFCVPLGPDLDTWQMSMLGESIYPTSIPMRINGWPITRTLPVARIELRQHLLHALNESQWKSISNLLSKPSHSKMETKLLSAIPWLSESTKSDKESSRFIKISVALETLLGGEPRDQRLSVRGVTAMLAERAAFVAGNDKDDRFAIDNAVRRYYGIRSSIVHGEENCLYREDIEGFGRLVRRLLLALMQKITEAPGTLTDVDDLERWVKDQRYSITGYTLSSTTPSPPD